MRKKQVSLQAELPLEQRIRVANFLLLLITIDRRLTLQAKAKKATKAANVVTTKARDIDPRTSRVILILKSDFAHFMPQAQECKKILKFMAVLRRMLTQTFFKDFISTVSFT